MAFKRKKVRIGDLLVQNGYITETQLNSALEEQKERKMKLGELLLALGYITPEKFAEALSDQLGIEWIDLRTDNIDENALKMINEDLMQRYGAIPFGFDEENPNVLKVAMAEPTNLDAIDDLVLVTNMEIEPYFATNVQIAIQLDRMFGKKQAMEAAEQYQQQHAEEMAEEEEEQNKSIEDAPIVKIVKGMLEQAVRERASDIHIEPMEKTLRIRYRIDGVLREVMDYNSNLLPAMVARIKIISGLDISEKRKPQDGRLTIDVDNKEYDVRVSILPTVYGEKVVMRLTQKDGLTKEKDIWDCRKRTKKD